MYRFTFGSVCVTLLLLACVGCSGPDDDQYTVVTEDSGFSATNQDLVEDNTDSAESVPTVDATDGSDVVSDDTPEVQETVDSPEGSKLEQVAELSVDNSRPFAVPLPVRLPAPASPTMEVATTVVDPVARIKLLIPEKVIVPESDGKLRVTYDDLDLLKILNMEPVPLDAADYFPEWLNDLNGKQVRIRGWMFPPNKPSGISRFLMMRDSGLCCFGPKAKIYDKIAVNLREDVTTDYIQLRPFDVTGTLVIDPVIFDDEEFYLLYHIEDATITE
ncbi:MAG: hypothetical protein KDA88_08415 [Planctomycetaceae bacterium]|nr:hypothetical protein [Planctomycetaceae bacterium]MCB9950635.1 hypothetical protein [Planctomycetaceae bacterium]